MTSTHLAYLNAKQLEVVRAPLQHLAVIAGAGSGKTRVLVERIAWLIEKEHISGNNILAVTFTNKAAIEMRSRVEQLTGLPIRSMWIGTFHGLAHRLLRLHWQQAGLTENFQILDADDQYRLLRKIHHELNLDNDKWPINQSQWYINSKKDEGIRAVYCPVNSHFDKILQSIYRVYEQHCIRMGVVDFAELLLCSYELLLQQSSVLLHYHQRFSQILVDEFQDTNRIQYAWLKLLAGHTAKMMIVGDDDQSIYSWRGAQIENIHRFTDDFPGPLIRLEQNYRSTQIILTAANNVIANNNNRFGKNLWTEGHVGEPISLYMAFNEVDEARFIVSEIKRWRNQQIPLDSMAILYRSNAQSRVLEEELLNSHIPYRVYGGLKFFERAEIKDALAYLRLITTPSDDGAFERAVNMPPRGIGNATLAIVRHYAASQSLSLWQASAEIITQGQLSARANHALYAFITLINKFRQEITTAPLNVFTKNVIEESGLYGHYSKDKSDKTQARLENLQELVQAISQHSVDATLSISPLQSFLSYAVLESGEKQAERYEESVQLMTLHAAKGLEFKIVFLAGMEEGLFPHKMALEESTRLEEERRLCYVGMTRAQLKLYLCYAETRRLNGTLSSRFKSRFIAEIPENLITEVRVRTQVFRPVTPYSSSPRPQLTQDTGLGFKLGEKVKHRNYGEGTILNYEGQGPQARIQVRFQSIGIKWLIAEFAKLEKA